MKISIPVIRCACFALALLASPAALCEIEMLDRVVAIVDKRTITQSELDERLDEIVSRSQNANIKLPAMSVLRQQVLDQLILETLQLNVAQRYGVTTSDEEVLNAIRRLMSQRNINENELAQSLAAEGITMNEFKENLRRQLTLQTISQGIVSARIQISEKDIDNFLKSADAQFWISPEYHLQHILVSLEGSGTDAVSAAHDKAAEIYQQLADGADFSAVAIAESKGPAALKGGDLGWRKSSELPTLFAEIVPSLEVGAISKPARSQAGFHILKLLEKRGDNSRLVTQSRVRHILVKPSEILDRKQALDKIQNIREAILEGEDFGKMARLNSEDIASKLKGGDLGWTDPGTFVPEFEQAVEQTPVGEISEPFFSQFGWHIVEVLERREEDLSERVIRNRARSLLISRRFEDEVQVWLHEMRDEAFVEIKI